MADFHQFLMIFNVYNSLIWAAYNIIRGEREGCRGELFKFNIQNAISQNNGKCELDGFLLKQSHIT